MNPPELFEQKPTWSVVPIVGLDPKNVGKKKKKGEQPVVIRHDLKYGPRKMASGVSESEVKKLRELADLYNEKGSEPRDIKSAGHVQLHLSLE